MSFHFELCEVKRNKINFIILSLFIRIRSVYSMLWIMPCRSSKVFTLLSHRCRSRTHWSCHRLTYALSGNVCLWTGSCDIYGTISFFPVLVSVKHAAKGMCPNKKIIRCCQARLEFNAIFFKFQKKEPLQAVQVFGKKVCNSNKYLRKNMHRRFAEFQMVTRGERNISIGNFCSTQISTILKRIV